MKAFTLIELLVVITIIGILAAISIAGYSEFKERAVSAQIRQELISIRTAIYTLEMDTGLSVGGINAEFPCVDGLEVSVDSCAAGLLCNDGTFDNWTGPYINMPLTDPYGNVYLFDSDYQCNGDVDGCKGSTETLRVLSSNGPDGIVNNYDEDETVLVLCGL